MEVVAGVDVGGTAVNYTLVDQQEKFLIEGLCEHPALVKQGPEICLQQIADGLAIASKKAGVAVSDIVAVGLDTPGPASAAGRFSVRGATNFVHSDWAGYDIREGLSHKLKKPVSYLNDANAAAIWGHYSIFGANSKETSISIVIGTGNGGGIILNGDVVKGKNGFGGELGHVLLPFQSIAGESQDPSEMQLRAGGRSGIALFADRDREKSAALFSAEISWTRVREDGPARSGETGARAGGKGRRAIQGNLPGTGPRARNVL